MNSDQGTTLLTLARNAIAGSLGAPTRHCQEAEWLDRPGASFVTLTCNNALRGCIGTLEAHRALRADVQHNAIAAAFRDPRFSPLTLREYADIEIEVSLLSSAEPMQFMDEGDALRQLRPGIDGVILEFGRHRSTFLPQVWEQLTRPADFIGHLKQKAGLARDFWADGIRLSRYSVNKWRERDPEIHGGHPS
jgi:hypothetical protein